VRDASHKVRVGAQGTRRGWDARGTTRRAREVRDTGAGRSVPSSWTNGRTGALPIIMSSQASSIYNGRSYFRGAWYGGARLKRFFFFGSNAGRSLLYQLAQSVLLKKNCSVHYVPGSSACYSLPPDSTRYSKTAPSTGRQAKHRAQKRLGLIGLPSTTAGSDRNG
jgi:hypothetical protein